MAHVLRFALAVVVLALSSGCYLAADGRALEAQVRALEARQNEFMSTFDSERERLTALLEEAEQEIESLNAALGEAQSMLNRNNAGLGVRVDEIALEIQQLRGALEESQHYAQQLQQELELLRMDMEIQLNAVLGGGQ